MRCRPIPLQETLQWQILSVISFCTGKRKTDKTLCAVKVKFQPAGGLHETLLGSDRALLAEVVWDVGSLGTRLHKTLTEQ